MISCKANNSTVLEFEIAPELQTDITHCLYFQDKYFFYFCEKYCENFEISKPSILFDGDLQALKVFVKHFSLYKNQVFYYPNFNSLEKDIIGLDGKLLWNYETLKHEVKFFSSHGTLY